LLRWFFQDHTLGCSALAAAFLVAVEKPESAGLMACFFAGGGCAGTGAASARNRSTADTSASPTSSARFVSYFGLAIGI